MATSTTDRTETPMTKTNMDLSELLAKHDRGELLRSIAEAVLLPIMEADDEGLIGAGHQPRRGRGQRGVVSTWVRPSASCSSCHSPASITMLQ